VALGVALGVFLIHVTTTSFTYNNADEGEWLGVALGVCDGVKEGVVLGVPDGVALGV